MCLKKTYIKILIDSDASASRIHESNVNKNNFSTKEASENQWSIMVGSFFMSHVDEIKLNLLELIVTAHLPAPFCIVTKKYNYNVIFGRDLLQELGIQLDFQNNFIG